MQILKVATLVALTTLVKMNTTCTFGPIRVIKSIDFGFIFLFRTIYPHRLSFSIFAISPKENHCIETECHLVSDQRRDQNGLGTFSKF